MVIIISHRLEINQAKLGGDLPLGEIGLGRPPPFLMAMRDHQK